MPVSSDFLRCCWTGICPPTRHHSFSGSFGAASAPTAPVVAILSETNNAPGTLGDNSDFSNSFEAENGIRQQASGSTVVIGEDATVVMKGSYEYIERIPASAAHLPKDIAAAVEAQIAFAAQEDAAGGFQSNSGFSGSSSFNGGSQFFSASNAVPVNANLPSYSA
ncbi:Uncharacterized protein FKW44_008181 [Caligus rogercresseyi]|uniref:Uncharacterized protein n=1 Tax=Caligus rogercresseyi TaxID=217165 RepID=A0A7T8KFS1_CALRO|nr:Uncharacterized protein FKW44_008181 [Caligus rogercresseyi]